MSKKMTEVVQTTMVQMKAIIKDTVFETKYTSIIKVICES